jgi:hypothetical protein
VQMQTLMWLGESLNIWAVWDLKLRFEDCPLYTLQSDGVTETRSRWTVICPTKDVPSGQEPIFLGVYGMCLHFHDKILSQVENSVYPRRRR